jgi:predicted N-acetyltransferase YhbS
VSTVLHDTSSFNNTQEGDYHMLDYAEKRLFGISRTGRRYVQAFVNDFDPEFEALVQSRGYQRAADYDRPMSQFIIPDPFPQITLPNGFRLKSLQDDNDLHKIDRVLWRGFGHEGEPSQDGIEGRRKMQSVPNFRKDLNIVVKAPDGNFASYSGTWFEQTNRIAYVEPVATDPDYRRRGLGKAAVLEGIRRCGELGATVAYVGSAQAFYMAMGFTKIYTSQCWTKYLDDY